MKNLYLFISLFICIGAYSQTTKSLQQDTVKHYIYVDIMGITKALRTTMSAKTTQTVNIFIDFGEGKIYTPENLMKDKGTDQPISFKSMVEVLNYFSKKGWKFETAYVIEQAAGSSFERHITHYLMKKIKK